MRFKKLLLVSLVLLTIFTISAVSASDNITDDTLSADDSAIELSDEEIKTDEILKADAHEEVLSLNDSNMKVDFVDQYDNGTIYTVNPETDFYVNDHDSDYLRVKFPSLVTGTLSLSIDGKIVNEREITAKTHYLFINTRSYGLTEGSHTWNLAYSGDDDYASTSLNGTFVLNPASETFVKKDSKMNVYVVTQDESGVIYAIDENKNLSIKNTKTDYFKVKFPKEVAGTLYLYIDGRLKSTKNITAKTHYFFTNAEEYNLKAGKHTWKIVYSGDDEYNSTSEDGTYTLYENTKQVPINKTTTSLSVPKTKIFKLSQKTKKYTVTLKANKKALKKVKVYLKLSSGKKYKKTFTAKTNSKGQATFKITGLTKKGTYTGTIKYKGSKDYKTIGYKITAKNVKSKLKITRGKVIPDTGNYYITVPIITADIDGQLDVSEVYTLLNEFRTQKGVWQLDENNQNTTFFNTNPSNTLKPLTTDAELENVAQRRAEEAYEVWNKTDELSHDRPDGSDCFTIYPELKDYGENLALGQTTAKQVMESWKETNEPYEFQGHRRNMLKPNFNCVGIAAYKMNGITVWAQAFGTR